MINLFGSVKKWVHSKINIELLSTMCMNVKKKYNISFVADNLMFEIVNLGMKSFTGKSPLSIDVISWNICSVVATDNTIDIHHWNNTELVILSQGFCLDSCRKQKVQEALNDKRCRSLTCVLPTDYINYWFLNFHW